MSFEKISGVTVVFLTNGQIRELRDGKTVSAKKFKEITNVSVQEDFVYIDLITPVYTDWAEKYSTTICYHTRQHIKEKTMKHPNYEFIVAFAEGKEVEFKVKGLDGAWDKWYPVKNFSPFSKPETYTFRFKPEKKKTLGYRRYVWKESDDDFVVKIAHPCFEAYEKSRGFIKWIDTEVQYEDVEE